MERNAGVAFNGALLNGVVPRFPTRTVVLMVLALISFVWFYIQMHKAKPASAAAELTVTPVKLSPAPTPAGAP